MEYYTKIITNAIFVVLLDCKSVNRSIFFIWSEPSYGSWIYNYLCNQFLSPLLLWAWISIRAKCSTLCDIVCQWLATGQWFSPGSPVSSINKTDRHDITEILSNKQIYMKCYHASYKMYFGQQFYMPIKLQKLHSILK